MDFSLAHFFWHITSATLFLTSLYALIIAVRSRLKTFYWYFVYSFFLLIYLQFTSSYNYFQPSALLPEQLYVVLRWFVQIIYNCAYFFFFIHLLDTKTHLALFTKRIQYFIIGIFALSVILALFSLSAGYESLFVSYFSLGFTPMVSIVGVIVLFKLWQLPGKLKIFFFIGGLSYLVFALIALVLSKLEGVNGYDEHDMAPIVYFYIGVIIEQILFGFALGFFTEQVNTNYQKAITKNLKLKELHNQELSEKLSKQSKRLNKMAEEAKAKKVALLKSKYESKLHESRLSSLHSKMNPHFIFNALNSIKVYLIENDKRKAVTYLNRFSKLVRKILESSRIEKISLKEELEIIRLYVEIENTRLNNSVEFTLNNKIDNDSQILLPPLILQPFIENALWHGLAPSRNKRILSLNVNSDKEHIYIEIEDNGIGRYESAKHKNIFKNKSMGMLLTKERFEVFNEKFGTDYRFEIIDKKGKTSGTLVRIFLRSFS